MNQVQAESDSYTRRMWALAVVACLIIGWIVVTGHEQATDRIEQAKVVSDAKLRALELDAQVKSAAQGSDKTSSDQKSSSDNKEKKRSRVDRMLRPETLEDCGLGLPDEDDVVTMREFEQAQDIYDSCVEELRAKNDYEASLYDSYGEYPDPGPDADMDEGPRGKMGW